jgi:hypothetical protein
MFGVQGNLIQYDMENKYMVVPQFNRGFAVIKNGQVGFEGTLLECEAWIRLDKEGYIPQTENQVTIKLDMKQVKL